MIELNGGINPELPDATFDLDGTVFKMTVLEVYTEWLSQQAIFDRIPPEVTAAKQLWKEDNTEETYNAHLGKLVRFFIEQVPGKSVSQLGEAADIVAQQQRHRRWNFTTSLINTVRPTHNLASISLMPEWLMKPFARDLGFVALIGSTYVAQDGKYTGEARTINKANEYAKMRNMNTSRLDIHIGDTIGDSSLFALARRPIAFNPSWTLYTQQEMKHVTTITSHKDVATVINRLDDSNGLAASVWGPPFNIPAILSEVRAKRELEN